MDVNGVGAVSHDMPAPVQQAPAPQPQRDAGNAPAIEVKTTGNSQPAQPNQPADNEQPEKISEETVDKTLEQINKSLVAYSREMHISVHSKLNRIMIKVMDTKENKVIREIPPEKVLDAFAKTLELAGILLDTKR